MSGKPSTHDGGQNFVADAPTHGTSVNTSASDGKDPAMVPIISPVTGSTASVGGLFNGLTAAKKSEMIDMIRRYSLACEGAASTRMHLADADSSDIIEQPEAADDDDALGATKVAKAVKLFQTQLQAAVDGRIDWSDVPQAVSDVEATLHDLLGRLEVLKDPITDNVDDMETA
jgi:hypothetical protein